MTELPNQTSVGVWAQEPDPQEIIATMRASLAALQDYDAIVQGIADRTAAQFMALVPAMLKEEADKARIVHVYRAPDRAPTELGATHSQLQTVLTALAAGASPFLVGPAGSGKTTLAKHLATALGVEFYMASRVTAEHKLLGYMDAKGQYVRTQFRDAYENGGLFLFDEVDASDADALTSFNAALAGDRGDFPDGMVQRHENFYALAAGNTYGRGADREYVGRNQLDAATLDRFQIFSIDYDDDLELRLAGNEQWTRKVQSYRRAALECRIRIVISPRASIVGAKLLAAGMAQEQVAEACVWKGLDQANKNRIIAANGERP